VDLDAPSIVGIADRAGIVAFAFSGVEVGMRRRLDVFGLVVLGVVTATGGGLLRDVLLGHLPYVLDRPDYLLLATGASAVAIPLVARVAGPWRALLAVADAAGLGAFAAAGALAATHYDLALPAVVALAMVNAAGGGVMRDVLADRVPLVLRAEINATAAGIGGLFAWAIVPVSDGLAALVCAGVAGFGRIAGLALGLNLPIPGRRSTR
jgi:uncharacterized membrane protein YeiH